MTVRNALPSGKSRGTDEMLCVDLIFKNQAMSSRDKDKEPQFVNDLLRTEFHKCVATQFVRSR